MAGARYIRYIILTFVVLTVLFFISSSSAPTTPVTPYVQSASGILRDKWRNTKPQTPGTIAPDSSTEITKEQLKNDIKQQLDLIPQASKPESEPAAAATATSPPPAPHVGAGLAPEHIVAASPQTSPNLQNGLKTGAAASGQRMNATFVTLARNGDIWEIAKSIREVEDRFNHQYHYDWVFLNEQPFDEEFIRITSKLVSGKTRYGLIGQEHWSFPDHIDQERAAAVRKDFGERGIIYGDSISYRHMCRFESGFFFQQPLMMEYEYYWRVEPSIKLFCDVNYDVFKFMAENDKKYGFVLSLYEYKETIETLWDSVKVFMKEHPEHLVANNSMEWLSDDGGKEYNHCHFWSNFEIGNLDWLRSKAYTDFFERLDLDGGFFYERWGDAPVHSIAAGLMLRKDQVHFFNDIGYYHVPFNHCPTDDTVRHENLCHCNPADNFDWNGYSCTGKWFDMLGLPHPPVH